MTTVQPAARAGATLRVIMAFGKFQGVLRDQRCLHVRRGQDARDADRLLQGRQHGTLRRSRTLMTTLRSAGLAAGITSP